MDREQFIEAFHQVADTPNGVEKLRGLILDLAVRGKLVPQDPSDEPASVLLERIKEEKARLVKEKKIQKSEPLPPIADDEIPFQVPEGWALNYLGNLSTVITKGSTPTTYGFAYQPSGINFVKVENILNGRLDKNSLSTFIGEDANDVLSRSQLKTGDLLFSIAGTIGKVCVIKDDDIPANTNQALAIIRGTSLILRENYLKYTLESAVTQWMNERARGGAMLNVSLSDLRSVPIPLPPLAEQDRIVAKVDELMALCDQLDEARQRREETRTALCISALDALMNAESDADLNAAWRRVSTHFTTVANHPEAVKSLRETILQLAVRGKLVPQDPSDEPASVLLERIKKEKARLVKEKKIQKSEPLPPIADDEIPFQVPEGWSWCRLETVFFPISTTGHKVKSKEVLKSGAIPVVDQSKQYIAGYTNLVDLAIQPLDGCVVFGDHTRAMKYIDFEFVTGADGTKILQPFQIVARYFYLVLTNYDLTARGYGRHYKLLLQQLFPLPPLAEQHRIVAKVDELMTLCDRLEQSLTQRHETALLLTESATQGVLDTLSIDS